MRSRLPKHWRSLSKGGANGWRGGDGPLPVLAIGDVPDQNPYSAAIAQTGVSAAGAEPDTVLLGLVIGMEAFSVGLGTAAFTAYIATTTDERYTATQFALFTSLAAVPRTFFNALTGFIVDQTGWFTFFLICFALAIPGMLLLPKIAPWHVRGQAGAR